MFKNNQYYFCMKKLLMGLMMGLTCFGLRAQEATTNGNKVTIDYSIDVVSRYIWRGLLYNASPNFQPTLSFTLGDFSIGSWASYSFNRNYAEVDLFLTYTKGPFSLTLFDYYNEDESDMASVKYFNWDRKVTGHALEGTIAWAGTESFPLRALAATFFYGNDRKVDGNQYYSTYFELGYPFSVNEYALDIFLGATPAEGLYHTSANIVNAGVTVSKEIKVTDNYALPVRATFVVNPAKEDVYFVVGITLK